MYRRGRLSASLLEKSAAVRTEEAIRRKINITGLAGWLVWAGTAGVVSAGTAGWTSRVGNGHAGPRENHSTDHSRGRQTANYDSPHNVPPS
ncbi:MAG: hypothetical protein QOJ06_2420 [Pseudonocardiales bacterium]|jgi:hypothetical protein|nr:hypothetical protein [Pseudonocardiales bacterium]